MRLFEKAARENDVPEKVTMDKSRADKAAIDEINKDWDGPIEVPQTMYRNNVIDQDHRTVKRNTRLLLDFKPFRTAQMFVMKVREFFFAVQFHALAGKLRSDSQRVWKISQIRQCSENATVPAIVLPMDEEI